MDEKLKQEIDNLVYISMSDFSRRIDEIKDMDDKITFAAEYLLSHKDNVDWPIAEAINIARMKLADGIAEYKLVEEKAERVKQSKEAFPEDEIEDVDLKPYGNVRDNKRLDQFMTYPALFLLKYGTSKMEELEKKNLGGTYTKYEMNKHNSFERNINFLNGNNLYLDLKTRDKNFLHINSRLETMYGSANALDNVPKKIRPGVFSSLLNTTSMEGRNLITAYNGFMDSKNPLYGNIETLERSANAYLKHIFPNWDDGYPLPDYHHINQLSGTQKSRTILCCNILNAVRKENKIDDNYKEITNDKEVEFDMTNMNEDNIIQKTNIENLNNDLDDSFSDENSLDNSQSNNIIDSEEVNI